MNLKSVLAVGGGVQSQEEDINIIGDVGGNRVLIWSGQGLSNMPTLALLLFPIREDIYGDYW